MHPRRCHRHPAWQKSVRAGARCPYLHATRAWRSNGRSGRHCASDAALGVQAVHTIPPAASAHHARIAVARGVAFVLRRLAVHIVLVAAETLSVPLQPEVLVSSAQVRAALPCNRSCRSQEQTRLRRAPQIDRPRPTVNPAADILERFRGHRRGLGRVASSTFTVEASAASGARLAGRAMQASAVHVRLIAVLHPVAARKAHAWCIRLVAIGLVAQAASTVSVRDARLANGTKDPNRATNVAAAV